MDEGHAMPEGLDLILRDFMDQVTMELGCSCHPNIMFVWHQIGAESHEGHYHCVAEHDTWCRSLEAR
jgi:hypothetical protein